MIVVVTMVVVAVAVAMAVIREGECLSVTLNRGSTATCNLSFFSLILSFTISTELVPVMPSIISSGVWVGEIVYVFVCVHAIIMYVYVYMHVCTRKMSSHVIRPACSTTSFALTASSRTCSVCMRVCTFDYKIRDSILHDRYDRRLFPRRRLASLAHALSLVLHVLYMHGYVCILAVRCVLVCIRVNVHVCVRVCTVVCVHVLYLAPQDRE